MKYPVGEWFEGLKGTKIYIIDKDNYKYICQTCGREIEGGMFDVCYYNVVKTVKNCLGCGVGIFPRKKWLKNTLGTEFIIHDCHNFEYICKTCGKKIKRRGSLYNSAENCMECYQSNNAVKTYNKYKLTPIKLSEEQIKLMGFKGYICECRTR